LLAGVWLCAVAACGVEGTVLRELPLTATEAGPFPGEAAAPDAGPDTGGESGLPVYSPGPGSGVFAGSDFTCALSAGRAYCWGDNAAGEIGTGEIGPGDGGPSPVPAPAAVVTGSAFSSLTAGYAHVCGLEAVTGRVLCWGSSGNGQLGLGDTNAQPTPQPVPLPSAAVVVAAGYHHTCVILDDGSLWCWGYNFEGAIGLDDPYNSPDVLSPQHVGVETWTAVAGGDGHTCAIQSTGTMWCWGRNTSGELGIGQAMTQAMMQLRAPTQVGSFSDWTSIDLGQDNACGLRRDGSLWCWGDGSSGELASPPATFYTPTQVGTDTDWQSVSTDIFSTCGVKKSGALYCWGRNIEGQLGTGDLNARTTPTLTGNGAVFALATAGHFHSCAETRDLIIDCTGADESGELGQGDTVRRNMFTAVPVP
jgi:alpha-tubulin suppressor-like RCC1 family protein